MSIDIRKKRWLMLDQVIKEINDGLSQDGDELSYVLMDKRLIRIGSTNEIDSWEMAVYNLNYLFNNWDELILDYEQDGGDEEYGAIEHWGGVTCWIESNCPLVGKSEVKEI